MSQFFINSSNAPGTISIVTITGNDGNEVPPDASGNINIEGNGLLSSGVSTAGNLYITGNAGSNTLIVNETQAKFITNYTTTNFAASPYDATATDYYVSVDTSGGATTIRLPNTSTANRIFLVKDRTGNAGVNNITVTTTGGVITIDGSTTYLIENAYESSSFLFNGTNWETF